MYLLNTFSNYILQIYVCIGLANIFSEAAHSDYTLSMQAQVFLLLLHRMNLEHLSYSAKFSTIGDPWSS